MSNKTAAQILAEIDAMPDDDDDNDTPVSPAPLPSLPPDLYKRAAHWQYLYDRGKQRHASVQHGYTDEDHQRWLEDTRHAQPCAGHVLQE